MGQMIRNDDMGALAEKSAQDGSKSSSKSPAGAHKALITHNLRLAYGEVASEPVPQKFLDLLRQLGDEEDNRS